MDKNNYFYIFGLFLATILLFGCVGGSELNNVPGGDQIEDTFDNVEGGTGDSDQGTSDGTTDSDTYVNKSSWEEDDNDGGNGKEGDTVEVPEGKELGTSDGEVPYAPIDEENIVTSMIGPSGGSVSTMLSDNVKLFVIIPEGELVGYATVMIYPYKEMPTGPNHPPLSNKLGYGAQVEISSFEMGIEGYLVFDTNGGQTQAEEQTRDPIFNRCDPSKAWFNPIICAYIKEVPAGNLINGKYGVVIPIHYKTDSDMVMPQPTIDVGIDDFIIAEFEGDDVYLPQQFDQDIVEILVESGMRYSGNNKEKLEAIALAFEYDVDLTYEQYWNAEMAINFYDSYSNMKKSIILGEELSDYGYSQSALTSDEDEAEDWYGDAEFTEENADYSKEDTFELSTFDVQAADDYMVLEAAITAKTLADYGVEGAQANYDSLIAELQGRMSEGGVPLEVLEALAMLGVEGANEAAVEELEKRARERIGETFGDSSSSISDILEAIGLAQLLGLEDEGDIYNEGMDKIRDILEEMLAGDNCKATYMKIAEIAQLLGMDDIAQQAMDAAEGADSECDCDALVKKNLENYGQNECK